MFQRKAYTLELGSGITDHPLYVAWAHLFTRVNVGDVAYRVNLCSAFSATLCAGSVHGLIRRLGGSLRSAWIGMGALAVSHAFWGHAVRAEVYSTYLLAFVAFLHFGILWLDDRRSVWLGLAAGCLMLSFSIHAMALTAGPAFVWLVSKARGGRQHLVALSGLLAGTIPLAVFTFINGGEALLVRQLGEMIFQGPAPRRWLADLGLLVGFCAYQFPLTLPLVVPGVRELRQRNRPALMFLLLAGLGNVVAVFDLQVPDRYVFFLPAFTVLAVLIGLGTHGIGDRLKMGRWLEWWAAVGAPVAIYTAVPFIFTLVGANPLGFRDLPYRDDDWFHLMPAKIGYIGPRLYGEQVLDQVAARAVIIADHTLRQNLLYFQIVEGRRPDVQVVEIYAGTGAQVPFIEGEIEDRPVFLATLDRYIDREDIEEVFQIVPAGLLFQLIPKGSPRACSD